MSSPGFNVLFLATYDYSYTLFCITYITCHCFGRIKGVELSCCFKVSVHLFVCTLGEGTTFHIYDRTILHSNLQLHPLRCIYNEMKFSGDFRSLGDLIVKLYGYMFYCYQFVLYKACDRSIIVIPVIHTSPLF